MLARVAARGWADAHRRLLHHRPRRAPGRLRPRVQGPVPHRLADAAAVRLGAGARGGDRTGGARRPGRPARPRPRRSVRSPASTHRRHRRHAAPHHAGVRRRARDLRVGQHPPRLRDAHALDVPRRVARHRVRAVDGRHSRTASRSSSTRVPVGLAKSLDLHSTPIGPRTTIEYDGTEGELYQVDDDPYAFVNRWDDPDYKADPRRPRRRSAGVAPRRDPAVAGPGVRVVRPPRANHPRLS